MSVEYVAILNHDKNIDQLKELRYYLNSRQFPDVKPLHRAIKEYGSYQIKISEGGDWKWRYPYPNNDLKAEWEQEKYIILDGMGVLQFGHHSCEFHIYLPYDMFNESMGIRRELRNIWFQFAKIISSPYAIYIPDNLFKPSAAAAMIYDGANLDEIRKWLVSQGEPRLNVIASPSENGKNIEDFDENHWYFIDEFTDLT